MEKNIIIVDGTSKAFLMKSIRQYEELRKCVVLKVYVHTDNSFILVEYDGICVTKWMGENIDDFLNDNYSGMDIISIM